MEGHAILLEVVPHVQVPVDNRDRAKASMPTLGQSRSAPRGKSWNARQHGVVLLERIVVY